MCKITTTSTFSFNRVVIATHNRGKLREFDLLFSPFGIESVCSCDLGIESVIEDGKTFTANAHIKSIHVATRTDLAVLADDSGLSVKGLDNSPGIHSSRYASSGFNDAMERILFSLKAKNLSTPLERAAKFTCALSFIPSKDKRVSQNITPQIFIGELEGYIGDKISGYGGFGYDPIFIPAGQTQTLAKFQVYEKQAISHRRKAFDKLFSHLKKNYGR